MYVNTLWLHQTLCLFEKLIRWLNEKYQPTAFAWGWKVVPFQIDSQEQMQRSNV